MGWTTVAGITLTRSASLCAASLRRTPHACAVGSVRSESIPLPVPLAFRNGVQCAAITSTPRFPAWPRAERDADCQCPLVGKRSGVGRGETSARVRRARTEATSRALGACRRSPRIGSAGTRPRRLQRSQPVPLDADGVQQRRIPSLPQAGDAGYACTPAHDGTPRQRQARNGLPSRSDVWRGSGRAVSRCGRALFRRQEAQSGPCLRCR